jgi:glyoxylase-like metal-dependent hydrolase (beta-lactamase superfamily II)
MNDIKTASTEVYGMPVGPLESNCFLVVETQDRHALLIDPGADPDKICDWCAMHRAQVEKILLTHGHGDHIGANAALKERLQVPIGIHEKEKDFLIDPLLNLSAYFDPVTSPAADFYLVDGEEIDWHGPAVKVLHTPGHSPGSVSFYSEGWLISGDVLFQGSIGRTDFPGSDMITLQKSIREKLLVLPPETVVYPGHGPATTIGEEIQSNPFLHLG